MQSCNQPFNPSQGALRRVLKDAFVADVDRPFRWFFRPPHQLKFPAAVHMNFVVAFEDQADAIVEEEVAGPVVAHHVRSAVGGLHLPRHHGFRCPHAGPQH